MKVLERTQWNCGWSKPDLYTVSFSSYYFLRAFLCASKFLLFAFTDDPKRLVLSARGLFRNPNLDENLWFTPQLERFSTCESLNWMTVDGGLRAYHMFGDALIKYMELVF